MESLKAHSNCIIVYRGQLQVQQLAMLDTTDRERRRLFLNSLV
jgi:hypothetical protein